MTRIDSVPPLPPMFDLAADVAEAMAARAPVVAVESATIDGSRPYPENLQQVAAVSAAIRAGGAVPAVLALMDGRLKVGLSDEDLFRLAADTGRRKISRRDIAIALAAGVNGTTTVASSLWIAAQAGISVFLTGGIGGVHRGFAETLDVSADLVELSRNRCIAVCGGAKPILDVPKTLEMLETFGVPVIGWQCDGFPLYMAEGRGPIDLRVESAAEAADVFLTSVAAGLEGGLLLAVPPTPEVALDADALESAVAGAVAEAEAAGVGGAKITGFVLQALSRATDGRSETIKRAVIERNAGVAAQVAVALAAATAQAAP